MRLPFALWSGVIAILAYAGFVYLEFRNFGVIDPIWPTAAKIAGVWLALVVLWIIVKTLRSSTGVMPQDVPPDVAQEIKRHPED